MCSWLPERPWCLMQFSCPVVSIRIDFQLGVLKDTERLKAPVLLDGTCCVPLENQSASFICLARKSIAQPTAPRSKTRSQPYMSRSKKHTASLLCLARKNTQSALCAPVPASAEHCTYPLAPALTCSADPYAFPSALALTRSRLRLTASAFSTIFSFHSSSGASS